MKFWGSYFFSKSWVFFPFKARSAFYSVSLGFQLILADFPLCCPQILDDTCSSASLETKTRMHLSSDMHLPWLLYKTVMPSGDHTEKSNFFN